MPSSVILSDPSDWWRGAVIYQVYPRSFLDSDGDGVGDLAGITAQLDYIADLGVDAVWLSPFFTSPMKDMGYDVSDYCDVDPIFGALADFDALIARAHELGLRVMIDQVLSHSSDQHPWFKDSAAGRDGDKRDWYVWAEAKPDGSPPNNWLSIFGGPAWTWNARRRQYYLHNFLSSQPDLNFHNPDVQAAMLETVRFWLDRGVDGFRLDTVNFYIHDALLRNNPVANEGGNDIPDINPYGFQDHIYDKTRPENLAFIKQLRALLDAYPGTAAVGEVGDGARSVKTMAQYTAGDDLLQMCYSFTMLGEVFSPPHFRECVEAFEAASQEYGGGTSWPCWAFSNHDVMRHVSRWGAYGDRADLAKLCASLLLSLRGSVCLYQGEELGLTEADLAFEDLTDPYGIVFWPEFKGRDGCRTPFPWQAALPHAGFSSVKPWLPVPEDHVTWAADTQCAADSIRSHYRQFLSFRKAHPALIKGEITFLAAPEGALIFLRTSPDATILCAFNLGTGPVTWALPSDLNVSALADHGHHGQLHDRDLTLPALDAFFGHVLS